MAAVANKPKPRTLCPLCYNSGVEVDLNFTGMIHKCGNGHEFADRDELSALSLEMNKKRRVAAPKVEEPTASVAVQPPPDNRVYIDDIDKQRIESILGPFGDSSTLFGNLFAMNETIKDLREKLQRAEDRIVISQIRKMGGDHSLSLSIPERHVQPIKDIADSGGMSVERYMQAKFEEGLDNLWYY
jgi:hypothetical protein